MNAWRQILSWEEDRGQVRRKFQVGEKAILRNRAIFPISDKLRDKQVEVIDYNPKRYARNLKLPGGTIRTPYRVKIAEQSAVVPPFWVCSYVLEPLQSEIQASLKLSWEEDPPNNPNRTSIENIKDFIGPAGIFVSDYSSLIKLLNKYSINAYPTMLDALKHYENNPEFKGYLVKYPPYTIDEKVYLEISMIKRSQGSEVYTTTSPLRIY